MARRSTPKQVVQVVGGGINTLAKAQQLRKERDEKQQQEREQRRLDNLAQKRTPQAEKAMEYKLRGVSIEDLDATSPVSIVFLATLEAFLTAEAVREGNRTVTGAVVVASENAAARDDLFGLFLDEATNADALKGSEWAVDALKWAGRQLNKKTEQPSTQAVATEQPATQAVATERVVVTAVPTPPPTKANAEVPVEEVVPNWTSQSEGYGNPTRVKARANVSE